MKRAVIFNADDLGRSRGINDGIFTAHRAGVVTSATLMVGEPAAADAAERLVEYPALGVGLHLTFTGARPTLPPSRLPTLVDDLGRLPRWPRLLESADPAEVLAEARHQLARFRSLVGRLPSHLDSHHHAHREPVVLDAVVALAREHDLPVRRASDFVAQRLAAEGLRTTDAFVETFFAEQATAEHLVAILDGLAPGVTEIMCHPGYADAALRRESTYADARDREIAVLTSAEIEQALLTRQIPRVTFDER